MATPVSTGRASYPCALVSSLPTLNRSRPTPNAPTTAEFLNIAMITLPSGGTEVRNAWGRTTWRSDWVKVRPIARAASAWPAGTELMPARSASQTNADV